MRSKQIHILPVQLGQEESDQHPACRTGRVFDIQIALSKNQSIFSLYRTIIDSIPPYLIRNVASRHPLCRFRSDCVNRNGFRRVASTAFCCSFFFLPRMKRRQPASSMSLPVRLCQQEWISASRIDTVLLQFFFSHDSRNAIGGKSGTTKIFFFYILTIRRRGT